MNCYEIDFIDLMVAQICTDTISIFNEVFEAIRAEEKEKYQHDKIMGVIKEVWGEY